MSAEKSPGKFTEVLCIFCNNRKMDIANIGGGGEGGSVLVSHKIFKKQSNKEKFHPVSCMFFTKTTPAVGSKPALLSTGNPHDESD